MFPAFLLCYGTSLSPSKFFRLSQKNMVSRRVGGVLSPAKETWTLFLMADVRSSKDHRRESRKSAQACIIRHRSMIYSARLYADRTLFLSTCASWRSITSERQPISLRSVDAILRKPCVVISPANPMLCSAQRTVFSLMGLRLLPCPRYRAAPH